MRRHEHRYGTHVDVWELQHKSRIVSCGVVVEDEDPCRCSSHLRGSNEKAEGAMDVHRSCLLAARCSCLLPFIALASAVTGPVPSFLPLNCNPTSPVFLMPAIFRDAKINGQVLQHFHPPYHHPAFHDRLRVTSCRSTALLCSQLTQCRQRRPTNAQLPWTSSNRLPKPEDAPPKSRHDWKPKGQEEHPTAQMARHQQLLRPRRSRARQNWHEKESRH